MFATIYERYTFVIVNNSSIFFIHTYTRRPTSCIRKTFSESIFIWRSVDVSKWHRRHLSLQRCAFHPVFLHSIMTSSHHFPCCFEFRFSPDHSLLKILNLTQTYFPQLKLKHRLYNARTLDKAYCTSIINNGLSR